MQFIGRSGSQVLFSIEDKAVLIDETKKIVLAIDQAEPLIASFVPEGDQTNPESVPYELAVSAATDLDIKVFSNNDRLYTIPKSVQAEAKRGLEWRKEENRGGTSVGLNTARTLARGGQIGIRKIRHIAKYFPRHEVDKKGKGYKPGVSEYPSNGRIAWALWGGDAAKSWATAIVNRENRKAQANSITASYNFVMSEYENPEQAQLSSFIEASTLPENLAPYFFVRIRLDGTGIDRLYKMNPDGSVYVWDDAMWEDLGNINNDFETYDRSLDEPYDTCPKMHIPVDVDTAIAVSGLIDADPEKTISVEKINPEESKLFLDEMHGVDWDLIDSISYDYTYEYPKYDEWMDFSDNTVVAAGEGGLDSTKPASGPTNQDGNYTPEERSKKASSQVRDKSGKFAQAGGKVVVGGNPQYTGTIQSINPDNQTVKVKFPNGNSVDVPANTTESADTFKPIPMKSERTPRNLTQGILGEPRVPMDRPYATMPDRLPQIGNDKVKILQEDYSAWTQNLRASNLTTPPTNAPTPAPTPAAKPAVNPYVQKVESAAFQKAAAELATYKSKNAYNDPLLRDFLEKTVTRPDGSTYSPNARFFMPSLSNPNMVEKYGKKPDATSWDESKDPSWLNKKPNAPWAPPVRSSGFVAAGAVEITPETSDVPPIYMAIVSPDDPQAVMDLVSLIPASSESDEPMTYIRKPGAWERDEAILIDIKSPTPPPMVVLDDNMLAAVMSQIDSATVASGYSFEKAVIALMAAGGVDKNRGNAEELRRYWLYGRGAAKIRWNTPGDWTRCVRQLSKYMGPRSKGYCALRHKEATGLWTGDKEHRQKFGKQGVKADAFSTDFIIPSNAVITQAIFKAQLADAKARVYGITADGSEETSNGAEFFIPLVIPEGIESGDGRKFDGGSITMRELPLPLLWQIKTGEGHSGSVVIGKITEMERIDGGIGNARGRFDTGEYGKEAERLVRGGFIRGVSADMDMFEAKEEQASESDSDSKVGGGKMNITKARVMAVTLVPKPAFQECRIVLADQVADQEEKQVIQDGVYVDGVNPLDASALVACGIVAGAIPVTPPKQWFDNPKLNKPTGLTVTDEGQVFGHIAAWNVDHIGMAFGTKPPRSKSKYSYFHTGLVRTEEGSDIPVGQLTLAGGHASLEASASEAVRHYDDTASAVADVHAGEDAYGIWVAGALRPGTTPEQIRALRASAPSGDWRPIKGSLELVAVCQVNVPGFPIARARVASGQVMALVAAGASVLAQLKHDPLADIQARLDRVESVTTEPLVAAANEAKARMESMTAAVKAGELSKRFKSIKDADSFYMTQMLDDDTTELAIIPRRERIRLAEEGKALKDGSFPIRNESDLRNAIHAFGRAKPGKRGLVRRHIVKMARALDRKDLVPEAWKEASDTTVTASLRERIAIVEAVLASGNKELPFVEGGQAPVSAEFADACPPATGDISINLANRQKAIDNGGYGPLNPEEPNDEFWQEKATRWSVDIQEAKKSVCGNCVMFIRTPKMLDCISAGLEAGDSSKNDAWDAIDTAELGYCEAFDFKCASSRTCDAWVVGGPITAAAPEAEAPVEPATPAPAGVEKPTVEITEKDIADLSDEELKALKQELKKKRQSERKVDGKYVPGKTQPRDTSGKFRTVLARLKADLGPNGSAEALAKIERVEQLDNTGNYLASAKAAGDLIGLVDRLDAGALNAESLENVRVTAQALGKTIANLPFAFGKDAQKIRFSDVPPVLQDLMRDMITRVEDKIGDKDAAEATQGLRTFMSGGDYFNQGEISGQMSKLLRLLT